MGRILDKRLVEEARAGDAKALRALVEATQSRLYRFCLVLCGDAIRAEDLAQEAYIKAFDNLASLKNPDAFIDWLFRLTRHLFIDQTRKTSESLLAAEDGDLGPEIPVAASISEAYAVHEALSQFEPEDRVLLMLVDLEGYTYAEAAQHLGTSEDAVRSKLFRLRQEFVKKWRGSETN